ncbi:uncharacterized protein LOC144098606 isoform X2 [Amblyomma americanum]
MQPAGRIRQPSPQRQARLRRQRPRLPSPRHGGRVAASRGAPGRGAAAAPASRCHCALQSLKRHDAQQTILAAI